MLIFDNIELYEDLILCQLELTKKYINTLIKTIDHHK